MKKPLQSRPKWLFALAAASGSFLAPMTASALEEIVVTAQRTQKSLFDTPVAVSAYSAEALEQAGVDDISDFNAANPSFMATPFLSDPLGNAPIRIRGIGTGGGNPGFEGAVGLYVDEVYRSRTGSALLTFFDMGGVEILRGPQGTLFGKNTTAGALLQKTAEPVIGENSISGKYSYSNYNTRKAEGVLNVSSTDSSAFRVAVLYEDQDGWFENPVSGEDTFWRENKAIRGSYKFDLSDELNGKVVLDWSAMESPGNYGTSTRLLEENGDALQDALAALATNTFPLDTTGAGLGEWYWDPADGSGHDPYDRDIRNSRNGEYRLNQRGATFHLNYDFSDDALLRSITGWRKIDSDSLNGDWDFGPADIGGGLDQLYVFDTFSQEFILDGSLDLDSISVDYVVGVNYFTEDIDYTRRARTGDQFGAALALLANGTFDPLGGGVTELNGCTLDPGNPICLPIAPFISNNDTSFNFQDVLFEQTEDSYGIFGHTTFNLTDQLSLIAGLRYNRIDKEADVDNRSGADQAEYATLTEENTFGFFVLNGAGLSSPDWDGERRDEELTYNVGVQLRPSDEMQVFATYSRGFKSGGFNLNENATGQNPSATGLQPFSDNRQFDPEYVDSYELGARWDVTDSARLSATLFYSDYDDLQVASFTGLTFVVVNAGSSTTEGLELEGEFAITDNLTLTAGATLMKAEYGDDVEFLPAGRRRGQTPDEAFVLGARYIQPLSGDKEFYINGNYSYNGEMYLAEGTEEPLRSLKQDGYSLVSVSTGFREIDSWEISAFCNNCFDEDYYEWAFNQPFQNAIAVNPAPPMTYGISVKKEFVD